MGGATRRLRRAIAERYDLACPDAVLATLLARRPVEILDPVTLVPTGRQDGLRSVPVPDGLLDPDA